MFANGTDFDVFMEKNCEQCPMYVHYEDATEKKPVCHIEERIALARIGEEEQFPYEWLDRNNFMPSYACRRRLGKKKRFRTVDELPKKPEPMSEETLKQLIKGIVIEVESDG